MKIFKYTEVSDYRLMMAAVDNATGSGAPGAGVTVTGEPLTVENTNENAPELIQPDIDAEVVKMRPEATPIDTLFRHGSSKSVGAIEFKYYAVDARPEKSALNAAYTTNAAQTSARVTLDAKDNDMFDVTDTILFPGTPCKVGSDENLVVRVVAKADDGKVIVMALNGTPAANGEEWFIVPSIAANAPMVRMGRAAGELDVQSPQLETLPASKTNYCQIFKMQAEVSSIYQNTKTKEVRWDMTDIEENAIYEMRKGIEKSLIFGAKSKVYDKNTKQHIYTTQGIWNQCTKKFNYTADGFTKEKFVDLCKLAFTGNSGHNRRVLIGGSDFISIVSKIALDKQLDANKTEVVWGITWNKIVTNFGTLYCLHDEVFDQVGMPGNGMIIDPEYLSKRVFKSFGKIDLDLIKSGQRNSNAVVFTEIAGAVLKYPDAHCKIILTE